MDDRPSLLPERLSELPERLSAIYRPDRFRRAVKRGLRIALTAILFGASAGVGLILHLDHRSARRVAERVANGVLDGPLDGRIEVADIRALSLGGATIGQARIFDPQGRLVIDASDVVAEIDTLGLLDSLLGDAGPVVVSIDRTRIGDATVVLAPNETGVVPSLADTFLPRDKTPAVGESRAVVIALPAITIERAKVTGEAGTALEAHVARVEAAVVVDTSSRVTVDVTQASLVERAILGHPIDAQVVYRFEFDLRTDEDRERAGVGDVDPMSMYAELAGTVGKVPVLVGASMLGTELDARASLANVKPGEIKEVFPFLPIARTASGSLRAKGPLPYLDLDADLTFQDTPGALRAQGALDLLGDDVVLRVGAEAHGLDARALLAEAPEVALDAKATIDVRLPRREPPLVALSFESRPTKTHGQDVPALDGSLLAGDGWLLIDAVAHEPGVELDARLRLQDGVVGFSAMLASNDLAQSPRVAPFATGAVRGRVDGRLVGGSELDARVEARAGGLRVPAANLGAETAHLRGRVSGPLSDLTVDANLDAGGAKLANEELDSVKLSASGPLLRPRVRVSVTDEQRGALSAEASVDVANRSISGARFDIERAGVSASGEVARLGFGPGGVEAQGVRIDGAGLGSLSGSLAVRRGELTGRLEGRAVDLAKLGRLGAIATPVAGLANLRLDLSRGAEGRLGELELELEDGRFGELDGISARLSAKLDKDAVIAQGYVRLVDEASVDQVIESRASLVEQAQLCDGVIAEVRLDRASGTLAGPLASPATWRALLGRAQVVADNWHLRCVHRRFPIVSELGGVASLRAEIERESTEVLASVNELYLRTRGLTVARDRIFSNRIDAQVTGGFDGKTGTLQAQTLLLDGLILADIDFVSILEAARLTAPETKLSEALANHPFEIDLLVPRRSLEGFHTLPEPFAEAIPALFGDVRIEGSLWGSAREPEAQLRVRGFAVAPKPKDALATPLLPPLDVALDARFDPDEGRLTSELELALEARPVLGARLELETDVAALLAERPSTEPLPYRANLFAQAFDFPLESIPALGDSRVRGGLSGRISLTDINARPKLEAALRLPSASVGPLPLSAKLDVAVKPAGGSENNDLTLAFDVEHDEGGLSLLAYSGVRFQQGVFPALAADQGGGIAISARDYRLLTLAPLLSPVLSKFDGKLNGEVALEWGRLQDGWKGRVTKADMRASDVVIYIPQFGQELHGGRASLSLAENAPAGSQEITLADVEAKGISGRITGAGSARLRGLELERADVSVAIARGEEVPITVEGVPLGKARGSAAIVITPTKDQVDIGVRVNEATIDLPASTSRDVIALDEDPRIVVLQQLQAPKEARRADATRYALSVELERVDVRSALLDAALRTSPQAPLTLLLSDRLHVGGDVLIDRGAIVLNKRSFEIDQGLVRLRDEDAGNPYVNLTAHWDGPEGDRIFVDYVGLLKPITDDKIRFRSDPPRSTPEILALLLFGESGATATGLVGTVGSTVATSFATDLMSAAFGGVVRDVAVNVGSTDEGGYLGAQVSLTDEWRVGGQVEQFSQNANGTSARQSGGCADLYADWRFAKNWSIRGSTGYCSFDDPTGERSDSGEFNLGVDVLWQYRY